MIRCSQSYSGMLSVLTLTQRFIFADRDNFFVDGFLPFWIRGEEADGKSQGMS